MTRKSLRTKRIFSIILSLAVALTMMPVSALAADGTSTVENAVAEVTIDSTTKQYTDINEAFAAAQEADSATVKLLADVTISHDDYSGIALKKGNITLDLNGKTLSKSTRDDNVFHAKNAVFWLSPPGASTKDEFLAALQTPVRLTVQDNSADKNGKIVQPNGGPAITAGFNTILTVNGGTIENTSSVDHDNESNKHMAPNCAVLLSGGGKAVINGGTLRGMRGVTVAGYITKEEEGLYKEHFGIEGYNNDTYGNELTVTGGNICATSGEALIVYEKAKKIELSGGIFTTLSNAYSIWVADTEAEGEPTIKGDASSLLASGYRYEYNGTECAYGEDGKGVAGNATVVPRPANEYAYIDKDGKLTTQANCTEITVSTEDISTPGWYVVKENLTISSLNISGEVNLILCDEATLTVRSYMNVTKGSTLNLFWQSAGSGKLTAAAISVLGTVTAPAGEMKQTTGEGGTTFEKCFEHDWEYKNNGDTHTAMCKLCGKAEAAESHKYDSWAPTNANTHTGTCACGATKTEDHTLTCTPNADGLTHSTKCSVCGYTAAAESHDFNQTDNYGKKCACGAYLAAECNGQQYATLARAIEAANGADITLLTIVSENVVVDGASIKAGIILGNGATINNIPYPSNWVADRNGIPLTMEAGEITLKNGALAQFTGYASANNAIALKGGTLTVADTVTKIIGSVASEYGQRAAIEATGGVLDLQGNTLLDGGLTMSGDAQLKNKLTAGTFTNSGSDTYSVSVEGSGQYTTVFDLLETGYAFAVYNEDALTGDVIAKDTTTRTLTKDVAVIKCTHKGANNKSLFKDNTCTGCGFTCAHENIENGVCTVCKQQMKAKTIASDGAEKYYLDLQDAFAGVADRGTVTMLETVKNDDMISFCHDAERHPVEKTVTLMMNGNSLSVEGAPTLYVESGKLIIGDDAAISQPAQAAQPAVFVDNTERSKDRGTLEFKGKATLTGGLFFQNYGKLVGGLKEGTIITSNGTYSVSVEQSTDTYDNVLGLLGDGLAFAKYDASAENKAGAIVDGSVKKLTEDVIVVAHTHSLDENNKCACGYTCTHKDSWTYTASGATITATCSKCSASGGSVTIKAPDKSTLTYTGQGHPATLVGQFTTGISTPAITYIQTAPTQQALESGAMPTNAGTYTASITLGEGENAKTASVEYTIEKATPRVESWRGYPRGWTFTENTPIANPTELTIANGTFRDITRFEWYNATKNADNYTEGAKLDGNPTDAGDYIIKAVFEESNNVYAAADALGLTIRKADNANNGVSIEVPLTVYPVSGEYIYNVDIAKALKNIPHGGGLEPNTTYGGISTNVNFVKLTKWDNGKLYVTMSPLANITGTTLGSITVNLTSKNYTVVPVVVNITLQPKQEVQDISVSMDNWTYGENAKTPRYDTMAGVEATVTYAAQGSSDFRTTVPTDAGNYTVKVQYETAIEIHTGTANFTIEPKSIAGATVTLKENGSDAEKPTLKLPYTGEAQIVAVGSVRLSGKEEALQETQDYTLSGNTKETNVGFYTVAVEGKGNYTGVANVSWEITPAPLTITGATAESRAYKQGDKAVKITSVTFGGVVPSGTPFQMNTDYTATGKMNDDKAGDSKDVNVTVELKGDAAKNYTLQNNTFETTANIKLADYGDKTASGFAQKGTSGTVDLSALIVEGGKLSLGTATDTNRILDGDPTVDGKTLKFKFNNSATADQTATVPVKVTNIPNYNGYDITVTLTVTDKDVPTLNVKNITKPYDGKEVSADEAHGAATFSGQTVAGTWSWKEDAAAPKNVVDSGIYTIVFKPTDTTKYAEAQTTITVTINKALITVTALNKQITVGQAVPDLGEPKPNKDYTVTGLVGNDQLGGTLKMKYQKNGQDVTVSTNNPGSYDIVITGVATPTNGDNYTLKLEKGTLTIQTQSSGGSTGGGSSSSGGGSSSGGSGGSGGSSSGDSDDSDNNDNTNQT